MYPSEETARHASAERFRKELRDFEEIPGAPHVLGKVLELTEENTTVSTNALADVIACDAALSARLLAVANSWAVGGTRSVVHIPQAILRLGFTQVRDLVAGVSVWARLGESRGITPTRRYALWLHSATVAAVAKRLARRAGLDPGRAYVCGVLHDVGKLVLGLRLGDTYWHMLEEAEERGDGLVRLEMESTGCHHATVGGWLLSRWGLPAPIVEAVSHHHGRAADRLAESVALADAIVVQAETSPQNCEEAIHRLHPPTAHMRVPDPAELVAIYADAVEETGRLVNLLACG
jgi:putative nucleotidyltransferase with HDIG domain